MEDGEVLVYDSLQHACAAGKAAGEGIIYLDVHTMHKICLISPPPPPPKVQMVQKKPYHSTVQNSIIFSLACLFIILHPSALEFRHCACEAVLDSDFDFACSPCVGGIRYERCPSERQFTYESLIHYQCIITKLIRHRLVIALNE